LAKRKKREPEAGKNKYQPTAQEKTVLGDHVARLKAAPIAPRIKVTKGEKATQIGLHHPDDTVGYGLLMKALGTADYSFGEGLLNQLANAGSQGGEVDEASVNFMLAVIKDIKPSDHLEAMLAAQMAAIHLATMTFTRRLAHVETIPQQDSAERALNKLARTYASQMEALKRYRTGGEQKVTVQHVSVSEGGQAIVGNVTQGSAVPQKPANATPALTDARKPEMPIIDKPERAPVALRRRQKDGGRSST
jgi:hypothetical protein